MIFYCFYSDLRHSLVLLQSNTLPTNQFWIFRSEWSSKTEVDRRRSENNLSLFFADKVIFFLSLDRFKLGALLVHIFGYIVNLFWINHFCGPNVLLWNWSWIAVKWSPRSSLFLFAAKTFFNIVEFQQSYCFLYLILLEIDTFFNSWLVPTPKFLRFGTGLEILFC